MSVFSDVARFEPNAPLVVSETAEGETIILHHGTGTYFSTTGSGLMIWEAVGGAVNVASIVDRMSKVYQVTPQIAQEAVSSFLQTLADHDLIRAASAEAIVQDIEMASAGPMAFAEPVLEVHTDLADFLLLDPIHDVDTAVGWPQPAAPRPKPRDPAAPLKAIQPEKPLR